MSSSKYRRFSVFPKKNRSALDTELWSEPPDVVRHVFEASQRLQSARATRHQR